MYLFCNFVFSHAFTSFVYGVRMEKACSYKQAFTVIFAINFKETQMIQKKNLKSSPSMSSSRKAIKTESVLSYLAKNSRERDWGHGGYGYKTNKILFDRHFCKRVEFKIHLNLTAFK